VVSPQFIQFKPSPFKLDSMPWKNPNQSEEYVESWATVVEAGGSVNWNVPEV